MSRQSQILRRDRITNRGPSPIPQSSSVLQQVQVTPPAPTAGPSHGNTTPRPTTPRPITPAQRSSLSRLVEQQAELKKSNERIERALVELSSRAAQSSEVSVRKKLPKELSVCDSCSVHVSLL